MRRLRHTPPHSATLRRTRNLDPKVGMILVELESGGGKLFFLIARRILGIPVERPSVMSSSKKSYGTTLIQATELAEI
jgi:hypothetical protein